MKRFKIYLGRHYMGYVYAEVHQLHTETHLHFFWNGTAIACVLDDCYRIEEDGK